MQPLELGSNRRFPVMRESLHDFMCVGIVQFMAYPQSKSSEHYLRTITSIIEDDFFGAIEITSAPDPVTENEVRQLLESSGVTVGFSAHPVLIGNQSGPQFVARRRETKGS